jgi:hypothetical protein
VELERAHYCSNRIAIRPITHNANGTARSIKIKRIRRVIYKESPSFEAQQTKAFGSAGVEFPPKTTVALASPASFPPHIELLCFKLISYLCQTQWV